VFRNLFRLMVMAILRRTALRKRISAERHHGSVTVASAHGIGSGSDPSVSSVGGMGIGSAGLVHMTPLGTLSRAYSHASGSGHSSIMTMS
jgi:hypothetical protein